MYCNDRDIKVNVIRGVESVVVKFRSDERRKERRVNLFVVWAVAWRANSSLLIPTSIFKEFLNKFTEG